MTACRRCDWRGPDLAEHVITSGHPACIVCHRSLTEHEPQACEQCLAATRDHLAGICLMWGELGRHTGARGRGYDQGSAPAADGKPLPGGAALVLASGGSAGGAARRLTGAESPDPVRWWLDGRIGPLSRVQYRDLERQREGREHAIDNQPTDPQSVAYLLTSWEDDWRSTRGEPAADLFGCSLARVLDAAQGYLEVRARWAANSHPAFDEFAADLRKMHSALEEVTGRTARRRVAEADCFECGGDLEMLWQDQARCEHERPTQELLTVIPLKTETPKQRDDRLDAWYSAHSKCQQGGYEDQWTCVRCGRKYDWASYLLAVRARLEEAS